MRLILPLIFSQLVSGTKQEEPGVKGCLTLKGLNYGKRMAPNYKTNVSFILSLPRIQIKKLDLSDSKAVYVPNNGTNLLVSNGQILITGSIFTNLEVFASGLSFTGKLGVTSDDKGHGKIWNEGCSSNVDDVEISFHGGWRKVDSVSSLEYQLVDLPQIKEQSLDLLVKGQFIGHSQRWDFPGQPVNLVLPEADSHMVLLALSEFSANSAGYVHFMSGILSYNVTDNIVSAGVRYIITYSCFFPSVFCLQITTQFPDSPTLLLHVWAHSPPAVTCQPDILTVNISVDMQLYATYPEKPPIPIFQIKAVSRLPVEGKLNTLHTIGRLIRASGVLRALWLKTEGAITMVCTRQRCRLNALLPANTYYSLAGPLGVNPLLAEKKKHIKKNTVSRGRGKMY
uniref:Bactericidal permeability-increasing protein n=1 Tax=Leptobrachium leishanense TaxID=445787 RepID=A0A8C5MSA7_9ANUR